MQSLSGIFTWLIKSTLMASVLVILIMLFKVALKNKLRPKWHYLIWILLILRLLIPYIPESPISIFNLFNSSVQIVNISSHNMTNNTNVSASLTALTESITSLMDVNDYSLAPIRRNKGLINFNSLYLVWLYGALFLGFYLILINAIFWVSVRKYKPCNNQRLLNILYECKLVMGVKNDITILKSHKSKSPAIYGFFKKRLLIPENLIETLPSDEIKHIFLHELGHIKRKDISANILMSVLQVLHWFNPFIWYAFYKISNDREIACDELALSHLSPNEYKKYGQTLLNMLKGYVEPKPIFGMMSILGNKSQLKRRITMITLFQKKSFKWTSLAVIIFIVLGSAALTGAVTRRNTDKIDYPFVNDSQVIGKWETVDFVKEIDEFTPEKKTWRGDAFLTGLAFINEGRMLASFENRNLGYTTFSWTQGIIIDSPDKTASKYELKAINGSTYMFFEWKSGDYTIRGKKPYYYVLKKVDDIDYSNYTPKKINIDNTDYPFVEDPQMLGKWESVDFVKNIEDFTPGAQSWDDELYLLNFNLSEKGVLDGATTQGRIPENLLSWTKGLILNTRDQTACACVIKEIDGATYMFFEWKSGDYVYRGAKPYYYVLKKGT